MINALLPDSSGQSGARVSRVCLVLSVWVSHKKPKLTTVPTPLDNCVALRVVQLTEQGNRHFSATARDLTWMLKPESVVAVLATDSFKDDSEGCEMVITEESAELIENMKLLGFSLQLRVVIL